MRQHYVTPEFIRERERGIDRERERERGAEGREGGRREARESERCKELIHLNFQIAGGSLVCMCVVRKVRDRE